MTASAGGGAPARALGILGGTFDPIHAGHLALAREARTILDLDHVLFVPNADPPHKRAQEVSAATHREAMLALAIRGEPGFRLSRLELERPGPSYTVDTVAEIARRGRAEGRPEPWFILSVEVLDDFDTWRDPERILDLCRIAVAPRPGAAPLDHAWLSAHYPGREDRFAPLPGPELDIASTDIRERVRRGRPIADLVPEPVARYIHSHGLYGAQSAMTPGLPSRGPLEDVIMDDVQSPQEDRAPLARPDPREAERPGLPSTRRPRQDDALQLGVVPSAVDEAVLRLAHRIVELASDKKASDIVLLDVRGQTTMTDYFVICSGASDRQLNAIADGIVEGAGDDGEAPLSREGEASSHWVLIDFGGVIVHVMSVPERDFYQLEKLWSRASLLLHVV